MPMTEMLTNHAHNNHTVASINANGAPGTSKLLSRALGFTVIDKGPLRLVITDAPTSFSLRSHTAQLKALNVKHVFRACEPTYDAAFLTDSGIAVHELYFPDGEAPSDTVANLWLSYLFKLFIAKPPNGTAGSTNVVLAKKSRSKSEEDSTVAPLNKELNERVAVHCITGLGRASVLAALGLIEFGNMNAVDAVNYIRAQRRGAINRTQLSWLMKYKRKSTTGNNISSVVWRRSKSGSFGTKVKKEKKTGCEIM